MAEALPSFQGLHVGAFESRRADEMARLIERLGGVPHVSPSMRELDAPHDATIADFTRRLVDGKIDVVVLLTGVGTRRLVAAATNVVKSNEFLAALARSVLVVRGPKPVTALKEFGLAPSLKAPAPNTWREVLAVLDAHFPMAGKIVAVQEYGEPNAQLLEALTDRGATVLPVKVYEWGFPQDTAPLAENVLRWSRGHLDAILFTSAHQVVNVLRIGQDLGIRDMLHSAAERLAVCSIGPTTSETLRELGLPVDIEPEHSRMGNLVQESARRVHDILSRKRGKRTANVIAPAVGDRGELDGGETSLFLRACRRERVERTPIWLMRQAGRFLPEYRAARAQGGFLELCKNPEWCADVMITAVNRLGVDAAIIFADLLPILEPLGLQLEYEQGEGPIIHNPVRCAADVERVRELDDPHRLEFVYETVRRTRSGLPRHTSVIGFAGAPFTLASYVIEGGASRNYVHTKALYLGDPGAWHELLGRLSRAVTSYLRCQIAAGADAVQIFDSWVGCLGPEDYRQFVLPHSRAVFQGLPAGVPAIHFGTGNPALLPQLAEAGGDVIGVDWRVRLDDAWRAVGYDRAVQGNLDPAALLAGPDEVRRRARVVLAQAAGRPGHIFNLGHGVLPQTPVENVLALVETVKEGCADAASRGL